MSSYTQAWLVWLMMFAVIEGTALFNRQAGDTLSEHVWRWFSVREKNSGWLLRRGALAVFLGWLSLHLVTGAFPS